MQVVDGHHRTKIAIELGHEWIPAIIYNFKSKAEEKVHIHETNVSRRQLNDFEKIKLSYELVSNDTNLEYGDGRIRELVAKNVGVSSATCQRGINIIENGSAELNESVTAGRMSINKAHGVVQRKQKRERLVAEARKLPRTGERFKLILDDFRACGLADDSIDCIFTDPPYDKESLPLYRELGRLAMRVLKPGCSLVTYIGGYSLPQIIDSLRESGLTYNWYCYMKHTGPTRLMNSNHVICEGKLLLWFYKGNRLKDTGKYVGDFVKSGQYDKSLHEWAQSAVEPEHFINQVTLENDTVLDPFMGSGTTGIAALKLDRQFIGFEIDKERFEVAQANISRATSKETDAR
jgi:16S rRNA G966 N2-methylase RsmD